jgi:hypothetical protein
MRQPYVSVSCLPRCPVYKRQIYVHLLVSSLHVFHGFRCTEQLCLPEKEKHIDNQHVRHVLSSQRNIGKNSWNN